MSLKINVIRESFEQVKPIGGKAMAKFYEILFSNHPEARPLFANVNMGQQQKALLNSLVYIVNHLDDPKSLSNYLFKMGQRHSGYGSQEEHYDWVGEALLETFGFFFKEAWTEELNSQWSMAFTAIKSMMLEGQVAAPVRGQDIRSRADEICNALLMEALESGIDERMVELIREKVRATMLACLEEESAKLLKKAG